MLCSIAVRRNLVPDEDGCWIVLRIASKHTLGNAGGSSREERGFSAETGLLAQLQALQVPNDVIVQAAACISADAQTDRFVTIGSGVQITFTLLEDQGFYLFD